MKKLNLLIIILLLTTLIYGLTGTITTFNSQSDPFNITFTGNENQTFTMDFPRYGYVQNLTLGINLTNLLYFNISFLDEISYNNVRDWIYGGKEYKKLAVDFDIQLNISGYLIQNDNYTFRITVNQFTSCGAGTTLNLTINLYNRTSLAWFEFGNCDLILPNGGDGGCSVFIKENNITSDLLNINNLYNYTLYVKINDVDDGCGNVGSDYGMLKGDVARNGLNVSTIYMWMEIGNIDNNLEWNYSGGFNLTTNASLNISKINQILNNNCDEGIIVGTDCRINFTFHSDTAGILEVEILNATYEYGIDNCTNFDYPILNMTYFDEITENAITVENNYDLSFAGLFTQAINGTFSGHSTDSFCTNINPDDRVLNWSVTGQITLTKSGYGTQIIDITSADSNIAANSPILNKAFTMIKLNESSTVVFTWLTITYKVIDGTMEIYRCEGDGTRTLVGSTPIIDGIAPVNLELLNTPYSYEIIVDGVRYTDDTSFTKCHIETDTTRQFLVDIEGVDISPTLGMYSIGCNVTRTGNNTVKMEWGTNPYNTDTITACMQAFRHSVSGTSMNYENCTTTEHSFERTIPLSGFDYSVSGRLYQSGFSIECLDMVEFKNQLTVANLFGPMGVLALFFLIVAFVLWYSENARMQQIGAIGGLVVSFIFGFLAVGWQTIVGLIFFLIIVMLVGRHSKKQ